MLETELKLLLNPTDIIKVKQHSLLQQANYQGEQLLYSVYFDTVEHDLLRNKIGFRIRNIGDKRIQTLKTAGTGVGGLHTRQEWETEITGDLPDYQQIPAEALAYLPANFNSIKPIFITKFNRITWLLSINNSLIEVALDQGEVRHVEQSKPINEIELELKSGSAVSLYETALILLDDIPFTIENKSKAALGYALQDKSSTPLVHETTPIKFDSSMNAEQAFIHIVWHCLQHLQDNEDVTLFKYNDKSLYQMQLASNRLLFVLDLYETLIPKEFYKILKPEIQWINAELTKQNYTKICDMLFSPRYTRTLLLLSKWLNTKL